MLLRAKERCGHGKWLAWLKANVRFSQRRAHRYMALAKFDVTSNLEGQWRLISGNGQDAADDADEAAPEPEAPIPESVTLADWEEMGKANRAKMLRV